MLPTKIVLFSNVQGNYKWLPNYFFLVSTKNYVEPFFPKKKKVLTRTRALQVKIMEKTVNVEFMNAPNIIIQFH